MKKIIVLLSLSLLLTCFSDLYTDQAKASEITDQITDDTTETTPQVVPIASYLTISQLPTKTTFEKGENLDLSGMVVNATYVDGTSADVTDYQISNYNNSQLGVQTLFITYQNQITFLTINVVPEKVKNVVVSSNDSSSVTLSWDEVQGASGYEVYLLDELTGVYNLQSLVYSNSITFYDAPGTVHRYRVSVIENYYGVEFRGEMSEECMAVIDPETVNNLVVNKNAPTAITLSWDATNGATGYLIYRASGTSKSYKLVGTTNSTTFISDKLASGSSYKFKVCAFAQNDTFTGNFSNIVDTSTTPAQITLKYKVGDGKIRFTWNKTNGATSYDIYVGDSFDGFTLLTTVTGNKSTYTYLAEGLITGNTYTFYAVARRSYKGMMYDSPTKYYDIEMIELAPTSTMALLYPTKAQFLNSWTYNNVSFVTKYLDYNKSFPIPGLATTNVGGFSSTSMCPQGLTFAGNYLLMSAYDMASEENSVIYVLDKKSKKLLTTMILPSKAHAGGLAYDGVNIWITTGSRVSAFYFADLEEAVLNGLPYADITYHSVCSLGITASYMTYYQNKIWVGSYNELKSTYLYSYEILDKDTIPYLQKVDTMYMPTRVQGVAFTKQGTLILSRSCQLYKGLRGYMRQLDVYKPNMKDQVNGVIQLGKLVNSVSMPSMNEDITIDGNYLYVNFESAAFKNSSYKMDRICAFKLTDVVKKK